MRPFHWISSAIGVLLLPALVSAAEQKPIELPVLSVVPFVLMLLAIAFLPLAAEHFWHRNRNKALVATLLSLPVAGYLIYLGPETNGRSTDALRHILEEYASFIVLLASLYIVSGGIVLRGDIQGRPLTNTTFLAVGAVLANFIGTTGASMLLIRPFLRTNHQRQRTRHLPVFFIFVVSNLGGLLTPLGDPPLFLGFLRGVDFFWTLRLWPHWLIANGLVLTIFYIWDRWAYRVEPIRALAADIRERIPLRVVGLRNLFLMAGVIAAVLLQSDKAAGKLGMAHLQKPWGELVMVAMALMSLLATPRRLRQENAYSWGAIIEVAVLFAGIFVTMAPALIVLVRRGPEIGLAEPWEYFWLTGGLSSFLDNAPTYLVFATLAASPHSIDWLMANKPLLLQAISCGAVFMGANTYIGNGPNFMVKAIADEAGFRMPSFFGYMVFSSLILLPVFAIITVLFFRLQDGEFPLGRFSRSAGQIPKATEKQAQSTNKRDFLD